MHGQIYLIIACLSIALAGGATYALVTDGGKIKATTAAAIVAAQSTVPQPPAREREDIDPPKPTLPAAAEYLRIELAQSLNLSPDEVVVMNAERATWTDSCLGLGGPAESCALMMTEGYRVVLSAGFGRYTYRTNLDGSVIRTE